MGVFATHIDDILGCGEPDVSAETRIYSERRFGELQLRKSSYVHVGKELEQDGNFSVTVA